MASGKKIMKEKRGNRDAKKLENRRKKTAKKMAKAIAEGKTIDLMAI